MISIIKNKTVLTGHAQSIAVFVFWIAVWQVISIAVSRPLLIPSPAEVAVTILQLAKTTAFLKAVGMSLLRVLTGYAAAVMLGTVLAVVTAKWRLAGAVLSPLLRTVRAIPVASFIILLLVWTSPSRLPATAVLFMVTPLVWETLGEGIRRMDAGLLEMARVFRLSRKQTLLRIQIPSVMPYFITVCVSGLGLAWKSGIAAEVICIPDMSIGQGIQRAKLYLESPKVFAFTIVVAVISLTLERCLIAAAGKFGRKYNVEGKV